MLKNKRLYSIVICIVLLICSTGCGNQAKDEKKVSSPLDPKNPTTITLWNYYNGDQLTAFDQLIAEFNSTVGIEEGIAVNSISQGSIDNLADGLIDAVDKKIGAQDVPTLAAIYSETAYILNQKKMLVNLDQYFTKDELSKYVPQFIDEGRLVNQGALYLFPISKSTECFAANQTDWVDFEKATGVSIDDIDSVEALTEAAKKYYEWTDSLTPDVKNDGKALYGRDSVANYILIGAYQLGHTLLAPDGDSVKIDLDKETMRKLWDNYYVPFVNGYFAAEASFRSEDMKMGTVLALTSSTSGVSYLPTEVTNSDDKKHDIDIVLKKPLCFKDSKEVEVQQGAGYCVLKGTEKEQYAAAEFLKWFTQSERNLTFSVSSGYSPVMVAANDEAKIKKETEKNDMSKKDENVKNALLLSSEIYMKDTTYTAKPYKGSKDVRSILDRTLTTIANKDRKAVVKAIKKGKTHEQAVAKYVSDEYFDAWYESLSAEVKAAIE